MESYESLLEEAYAKVKPIQAGGERFEVSKIEGHIEGNKTILTNLQQIASYIRRDVNHLLTYLLKELATPGVIEGSRVVLQRKISSQKINEKIQSYIQEFVICRECSKPDTELTKQDKFTFVHCLACGAKHSVRTKL